MYLHVTLYGTLYDAIVTVAYDACTRVVNPAKFNNFIELRLIYYSCTCVVGYSYSTAFSPNLFDSAFKQLCII